MFEENSRYAQLARYGDIQWTHPGRHHKNLSLVSGRKGRGDEARAGVILQIEIKKHDVHGGTGERLQSLRGRAAFGNRLEIRFRDQEPPQALPEQNVVVKQ